MNTLTAHHISDHHQEIRAGQLARPWMDETPQRFAYRCLPMVLANQLGWDILNPVTFKAGWSGDKPQNAVSIWGDVDPSLVCSHFGCGILTFRIPYLFRTPPGVNLLVMGPPNHLKDAIQPLVGFVETDWTIATFTMNWRFTRRMRVVQFDAGEPICRIVPVQRGLVESLDPAISKDVPDGYAEWKESREQFNANLKEPGSEATRRKWQREYFLGDGGPADHQMKLNVKEFTHDNKTVVLPDMRPES